MSRGKNDQSTGNPYLIAIRAFPKRLARAKKSWELQTEGDLGWAEIGKRIGLSPASMSEVKRGERPPRAEEAVLLAGILGVRPEWLLLDSGPMTVAEPEEIVNAVQQTGARPMHPSQFRAAPEPAAKKKRRANGG